MKKPKFTLADVEVWTTGILSDFSKQYLVDLLNGDYDLEEARKDCESLIEKKGN